jgi:heavy metal translocating P-type ATPase
MKKLLRFGWRYKLLSLAVLASLVALGLDLGGIDRAAHIILISVSLFAAIPIMVKMIRDLSHGVYGIDLLALTAIISAVILKEYWTAIVIVLMFTGGESLERFAEHRSKTELDALLKQSPTRAHVLRGSKTVDTSARLVQVGDRIIIKPGEVVPVDAVIMDGTASFDESSLTGESIPGSKTKGEQILSGSINLDGVITAKAIHTASDSQYQQIVKLIRSASHSRAPFVRLADRYSIPFTLTAFAIAGAVWVYSGDPIRFLEVIVVATPCPLLLAAPIAIISGMSRASKHGIIVRTGSAFERLTKIHTLAFDKTGTLTAGKPKVSEIQTFGSYTKSDVLGYAAALEATSTHVLAQAINEAATDKKLKVPKARHMVESSGRGLTGTVSGKRIVLGRKVFIDEHDIELPEKFRVTSVKQTATYVAVNGKLAGILTFADTIRPETPATLKLLRKLGIKQFEMVTGDNKAAAAAVASELGIDQVTSDALPADKLLAIEGIKGRPVAFVGDGVNDAPVLTAADVGIALGARGSTAASESADLVILEDNIGRVATSLAIAKRTFRIAKQSVFVGIGLSVFLMLIFATGKFTPLYGAVLQEVVDVIVIFNALRAHIDKGEHSLIAEAAKS